MIMGGYLADIPKPHRRKFPGDHPREVRVRLTSWIGISPGAKHWYVDIKEEDNYLWDEAEHSWRIAWDDKKGQGPSERAEFAGLDARDQALRWIRKMVRERYSNKSLWKVERDYMRSVGPPVPWDGD